MNAKKTLPSGAVLEIDLLDYEDAWGVFQTVAKTVDTLQLDLKSIDFENFTNADILGFKGPVCQILSSKEVMDAAWLCFKKCTYDGRRIVSKDIFSAKESRGDVIPAAFYAIKENITPFLDGLLSYLKTK